MFKQNPSIAIRTRDIVTVSGGGVKLYIVPKKADFSFQ